MNGGLPGSRGQLHRHAAVRTPLPYADVPAARPPRKRFARPVLLVQYAPAAAALGGADMEFPGLRTLRWIAPLPNMLAKNCRWSP